MRGFPLHIVVGLVWAGFGQGLVLVKVLPTRSRADRDIDKIEIDQVETPNFKSLTIKSTTTTTSTTLAIMCRTVFNTGSGISSEDSYATSSECDR